MTNGSPFMNGIILTVTVALFVVGACYGFGCGKYKNDRDLFADITLGFKDMAGYIFMCFFIAQFTSYFAWSNLGIVMAIKGAEALKAMEFTGAPLLIGLIFVSCIVNILIGSASAKWAILAPIFVPMLMLMGFDPAVRSSYRIGDSITNPLSPLFPYCPVIWVLYAGTRRKWGLALLSPTWCRFPLLLRLSGLSSFWYGFSSIFLLARAAAFSLTDNLNANTAAA